MDKWQKLLIREDNILGLDIICFLYQQIQVKGNENECLQSPYGKSQSRKTQTRNYQLFRKSSFVRLCLFWNCLPASIPSDCDREESRKRATNSVQPSNFYSFSSLYPFQLVYISDVRIVLFPHFCPCLPFLLCCICR